MRLTDFEKNTIIELAKKYFGNNTRVYLFGSRVYDNEKGGDIDLFLETDKERDRAAEMEFLTKYHRLVNERKVDLIVKTPSSIYRPIFDTARSTGIPLC
jgi:predicted nucleotidyltransferase